MHVTHGGVLYAVGVGHTERGSKLGSRIEQLTMMYKVLPKDA